jgi:hypothetical protein
MIIKHLCVNKWSNFRNIHYIDYEGGEHYFTAKEYPVYLEKKIKLLHYFMNYMKEHLLKAGANMQVIILASSNRFK